jgi:ribonuclease P protein component
MLSHKYRFHGHGSLRYVYRNGQTARNRNIAIRFSPNKHRASSRIAVVVGKKILKSAVKRNRIRRRIFEVLRVHWEYLAGNTDMVITVFSAELLTMTHEELEATVLDALKQGHLYKKQKNPAILEREL